MTAYARRTSLKACARYGTCANRRRLVCRSAMVDNHAWLSFWLQRSR